MILPIAGFKPKFYLLQEGDVIEKTDEYYNPIWDRWMLVDKEFVGTNWSSDQSKPVRRKNDNSIH